MSALLLLLIPLALAAGDKDPDNPLSWRLQQELLAPDRPVADLQVVVQVLPEANAPELAALAEGKVPGLRVELVVDRWLQLQLPWDALEGLAALPGVQWVRHPRRPKAKDVVSEGVADMAVQDWAELGLDGEGVTVAVLDVGFDGYEALLGSELPDQVGGRLLTDWERSSHGTAVAEIIHDLAPGAALNLYDYHSQVEFLSTVLLIAESDAQLVNASIGYDNIWHADGTSPFSTAVDFLSRQGIAWFNAAGNEVGHYTIGQLSDSDGDDFMELDGVEDIPILADHGYVEVSIRWDEVFGAAATDLDLFVYDSQGVLCDSSRDGQNGNDEPYEEVECELDDGGEMAWLRIERWEGPADGLKLWVYSDEGVPEEAESVEGTLTLPADAEGAIAVAAVDWEDRRIMSYSSHGPTDDGRLKPDLAAPSWVSTAVREPDRFGGTSAATPHATGMAALVLEGLGPETRPAELKEWMQASVIDLGPTGPDTTFGAGYLQMDEAPGQGPVDTGEPADDTGEALDDSDEPVGPQPEAYEPPPEPKWSCSTGAGAPALALSLAAALTLFSRRRE